MRELWECARVVDLRRDLEVRFSSAFLVLLRERFSEAERFHVQAGCYRKKSSLLRQNPLKVAHCHITHIHRTCASLPQDKQYCVPQILNLQTEVVCPIFFLPSAPLPFISNIACFKTRQRTIYAMIVDYLLFFS